MAMIRLLEFIDEALEVVASEAASEGNLSVGAGSTLSGGYEIVARKDSEGRAEELEGREEELEGSSRTVALDDATELEGSSGICTMNASTSIWHSLG